MVAYLTVAADLRDAFPSAPFDQGKRNTCVPIAVSGAHEHARRLLPNAASLAPEPLWLHAWHAGAASTQGTSIAAIRSALLEQGQTTLEDWPYDPSITTAGSPPSGAGEPPWLRAELGHNKAYVDELWAKLLGGEPAVVVVAVVDALYKADSLTGVVTTPEASTRIFGLHAVLCVGLAEDEAGRRYFLVRNSWGARWGSDGHGWLPEDFVRTFATSMSWVHGVVPTASEEAVRLSMRS